MPPTLDFSRTTHKMIVSPPRINLRRAASYTHDKGPQSSTSSRFGFEHLLFASPPPSPGLPQLLPRKKKASHIPRPRRVVRVVVYCLGLLSVTYLACTVLFGGPAHVRTVHDGFYMWPTEAGTAPRTDGSYHGFDTVARSKLPGHPTPVIVSDKHGKAKWTVSIPPNAKFPLAAEEYTSICDKCVDVANRVDILRRRSSGGIHSLSMGAISSINKSHKPKSAAERMQTFDNNFIDVHEAEEAGYLTGSVSIATLMNQQADNNDDGNIVGEEDTLSARRAQKPVCSRSLTFVLASTDAGLGRTLMLLWMAYAQAQAEGRGFFIDDTRWAYGRYAQIFAPPPSPNCRPPLRHEMLPCPHQARHLVMTVDTASRFILAENDDGAEDITPEHTAHLFDLAYKGYEALFHLNVDDAKHVAKRVKEIKAEAAGEKLSSNADSSKKEHGAIVGVHVRRGDRRPAEFQYRDSYLPLNLYADRATGEIAASAHARGKGSFPSSLPSVMVLATDDPMVYQAEEFAGATRAQKHIRLANKAVTEPPVPQRGVLHKFVDEAFGWEGGFYAAMFWNLGGAASPAPDTVPVAAEALRIRSLVGRAYMMDLAVLAESSDQVVCAVSATGCRLLAVMMGRDKALKQGRWINIDGDYGWWAADF